MTNQITKLQNLQIETLVSQVQFFLKLLRKQFPRGNQLLIDPQGLQFHRPILRSYVFLSFMAIAYVYIRLLDYLFIGTVVSCGSNDSKSIGSILSL